MKSGVNSIKLTLIIQVTALLLKNCMMKGRISASLIQIMEVIKGTTMEAESQIAPLERKVVLNMT